MKEPLAPDELDDMNKFIASLPPVMLRCSLPIVEKRGDTIVVHGTANLIEFHTGLYGFTAAHVLDPFGDTQRDLFYQTSHGLFALGDWERTSKAEDAIDLAASRIRPDLVEHLAEFHPIQVTNLPLRPPYNFSANLVAGFPFVCARPGSIPNMAAAEAVQYCIGTSPYTGSTEGFRTYLPAFHLLMEADIADCVDQTGNAARFLTYTGWEARFPADLGGISGAAIWAIHSEPTEKGPMLSPYVVGVEHLVYPDRNCMQGTKIEQLLLRMQQWFPEIMQRPR